MEYKAKAWLRDAAKMTVFGLTLGWILSCPGHLNDYRDNIDHPYKWEIQQKKVTQDMPMVMPPR